jgi:hypothetical protein
MLMLLANREGVPTRRTSPLFRGAGFFLIACFAWTLILASAPDLHELIHAGADSPAHSCAVTTLHAGGLDASPAALICSAPLLFAALEGVIRCDDELPSSTWSYLAHEHAPPVLLA